MTDFKDRVYKAVMKIPRGSVASYGEVAAAAGSKNAARAVGNILHNNPAQGIIPCHRVVHADGRLADAFAFGGAGEQRRLLQDEGVILDNDIVDMKKYGCIIN